jgi:hypothetical protein
LYASGPSYAGGLVRRMEVQASQGKNAKPHLKRKKKHLKRKKKQEKLEAQLKWQNI